MDRSHCRAFEFFGGVTEILTNDNLKSGVTRPCRYEPDINPAYQEMASYYGTVVIPACPRKPRDKAKAESAVQVVERWVLAALRNRTFFSLDELNLAISEQLDRLNDRPFQKLPGSRRTLFETLEKPALKPLPGQRFEVAEWKKARVNIDYHVEVDHNYYSVPYQMIHKVVEIRLTATTLEILCKGKRIASHRRSYGRGVYITCDQHRPAAHRKYLEWTPTRIVRWAEGTGPRTAQLVSGIFESRRHPEQCFRSCLGIMRLGQRYSPERLEAAATRALTMGSVSYRSIKLILERGLDRVASEPLPPASPPTTHSNLRGAAYFASEGGKTPC